MPSLTTIQGKLLLLVATLVTAILSFHWLAAPWFQWTIAVTGPAFLGQVGG